MGFGCDRGHTFDCWQGLMTKDSSPKPGQEMLAWAHDLFPLPRSLTGPGVRATLAYLQERLPELELHQVPSGALHKDCFLVVGNGVVLNLEVFQQELDRLLARGFDLNGRLLLSEKAHVILPYHIIEDAVYEKRRGEQAIGTTGRGIGTCYRDKALRSHAIRIGDLYHPESFRSRLKEIVAAKNLMLKALDPSVEDLDADAIFASYSGR